MNGGFAFGWLLAVFGRSSHVDYDLAAAHVGFVEHFDGLFGTGFVGHFDESESARTAGFAVRRNEHGNHITGRAKMLFEFRVGCAIRNATNK